MGGAYVDNVTVLAAKPPGAERCLGAVRRAAEARGLSLHDPEVGEVVGSLGLVVDLVKRELRHAPERLWRFWAATQAPRHRRHVRSGDLEAWLGHAINMMRLRRPLMSILQEDYHRIDVRRERRVEIDYVLRREMGAVQSLDFFAYVSRDRSGSALGDGPRL